MTGTVIGVTKRLATPLEYLLNFETEEGAWFAVRVGRLGSIEPKPDDLLTINPLAVPGDDCYLKVLGKKYQYRFVVRQGPH